MFHWSSSPPTLTPQCLYMWHQVYECMLGVCLRIASVRSVISLPVIPYSPSLYYESCSPGAAWFNVRSGLQKFSYMYYYLGRLLPTTYIKIYQKKNNKKDGRLFQNNKCIGKVHLYQNMYIKNKL